MPNNPLRDPDLRHRSIYLLPNAFTTAALFAGFYAVVQAMNGRFEMAAIAIFVAMVLDGMDGRVARLTNTTSAFGEQYDSLSDMTSFGVAPALVMYEWMLQDLGRWGWLAAFVYVCGAALRLARFNTNIAVVDKRFFQGLPSPAAGALIAGFVWLVVDNRLQVPHEFLAWTAFAITIYCGIAMVSNLPQVLSLSQATRPSFCLACLLFTDYQAGGSGCGAGVATPSRWRCAAAANKHALEPVCYRGGF